MKISDLARFSISAALVRQLETDFQLLLPDCQLDEGRTFPGLSSLPPTSGCYMWVVRHQSNYYSIYAGCTNSIRRRALDYSAPFQMHSPNDFKLRFFEQELRHAASDSKLALYFQPLPGALSAKREQQLIAVFRPAINTLPIPDAANRGFIQKAYRRYYRSAFLQHAASNI